MARGGNGFLQYIFLGYHQLVSVIFSGTMNFFFPFLFPSDRNLLAIEVLKIKKRKIMDLLDKLKEEQ